MDTIMIYIRKEQGYKYIFTQKQQPTCSWSQRSAFSNIASFVNKWSLTGVLYVHLYLLDS